MFDDSPAAETTVFERLRRMILDHRWKAGDALPGERDLSSELNCSRASLREALQVLEAQGIIDRKPGGGSTIRHQARSAIGGVMELQLALGMYTTAELLHTRVAIEMWSARRAATTREDEHLVEMKELVERMGERHIPVREFNNLDAEFHSLIAVAAGNSIIKDLNRSFRTAIEQQMIEAYDAFDDWWEHTHQVRREHAQIVEAIERRDPELAAALVRSHIMSFFAEALTGPARPTS